jgi:hypothetical protein
MLEAHRNTSYGPQVRYRILKAAWNVWVPTPIDITFMAQSNARPRNCSRHYLGIVLSDQTLVFLRSALLQSAGRFPGGDQVPSADVRR